MTHAFASQIYMFTWVMTGEKTSRRIREAYLRSILRQNIGFFDKIGAGEVTTRITSDIHLIQEGISEKIPITFQFIAQFVCATKPLQMEYTDGHTCSS